MLNCPDEEELSVGALQRERAVCDVERAETTVRHHLYVLQDVGLVERLGLEEAGSGMRKYSA